MRIRENEQCREGNNGGNEKWKKKRKKIVLIYEEENMWIWWNERTNTMLYFGGKKKWNEMSVVSEYDQMQVMVCVRMVYKYLKKVNNQNKILFWKKYFI